VAVRLAVPKRLRVIRVCRGVVVVALDRVTPLAMVSPTRGAVVVAVTQVSTPDRTRLVVEAVPVSSS
jgi:hypothetical protein